MIEVQSKVDADTVYKVFDKSIAIHRDGDAMKIAFVNLNTAIKRFRQDIQDEILDAVGPETLGKCSECGDLFVFGRNKSQKTCGETCKKKRDKRLQREKYKLKVEEAKLKDESKVTLSDINAKAKSMGMSYGQYQAMLYKENMTW